MQLIILIHGMWGKAGDFNYIVNELEQVGYVTYDYAISGTSEASASESPAGIVYCTRSNEGYFTYDGIDVCGLRIANEISHVVRQLQTQDWKISELSIVGYSMGGLMARYAVGLLYTRGIFDEITPRALVTTCSPHIGVNVLSKSKGARLFNFVGSWSMARTSRQAFLRDSDQPHQLPLFLYLTQKNTSCTKALSLFGRRVLYANVFNDHRCEFYTAAAETTDPFKHQDLRLLSGPFVPGYEPIVLHGGPTPFYKQSSDIEDAPKSAPLSGFRSVGHWLLHSWLGHRVYRFFKILKLIAKLGVVLPLWFLAFLINVGYQHTASSLRIRSTLRSRAHVHHEESPEMLETSAEYLVEDAYRTVQDESEVSPSDIPVTPLMSRTIEQFNALGWEKYFLRIIDASKPHSAAIMKSPKRKDFYEGKTAVKHLVNVLTS